jgi:hypothetical protein
MNSSDQTTHGEEPAEQDAIEIQRLLAWYYRTEYPSRHSAVGDRWDAAKRWCDTGGGARPMGGAPRNHARGSHLGRNR